MNNLLKIALIGIMSTLVGGTAIVADQRLYERQHVVYHINYDNPKAQAGALKHIQNHIHAVGANFLDLRVVLHGDGLSLLLEPSSLNKVKNFKFANANEEMTAKIAALKDEGVAFYVCGITAADRKVDYRTDLYDVEISDLVLSGVAEIAALQAGGFAYIKP